MSPINRKRVLYLKYISLALLIILSLAFFQFTFVYEVEIQAKLIAVPAVVALILGSMLAYQRQLKDEHEYQERQFVAIVEMADEVAYLQKTTGEYQFVSSGIKALTGYFPSSFYEMPNFFESLILAEDKASWQACYQQLMVASKTHRKESAELVVRIRHQTGQVVWVKHRVKPIYEEGQLKLFSAMNIDVSEQVQQEQALQSLVVTDQLTRLPNRRALEARAQTLISQQQPFYLVMMDLNRFKSVNDSMGHTVGDLLLVELAQRFHSLLSDQVCIVRFGGDEFVFVVTEEVVFADVMQQIETFIAEPLLIKGFEIQLGGSFGYVHYPDDAQDFETLVRYADAAMYQAKQASHSNSLRYQGDSIEAHEKTMFIERTLMSAIQSQKIFPYFQPLYDISGSRIVGVECLARWQDETYGWIAPDEFIGLAEAANLIRLLGESMIAQVLAVAKQVNQGRKEILPFSVNVSVKQLLEADFSDKLKASLAASGVDARYLKIEVTESLFLGHSKQAMAVLEELRSQGIKVSLDDFGTGYSALAVLKDHCLDQVKMDKAFMENIEQSPQAQALLQYVIKMAHALGLEVVAEGVETEAQKRLLQQLGCDLLQGYLLSRPLSQADFIEALGA